MSLLNAPNESEAALQAALPPLRGLAKFGLRYRSATDLQKILSDCSDAAPCLVNDNEVAVKAPSASLAALYRQIDEIFHNGKGKEEQRDEVMGAIGAFSTTVKREEFQQYIHWNESHYTRNLVGATADFEMIVICWKDKQKSRIHNHAGGRCFVGCLQGPLTESLYENFMDRDRMERNDPKDLQVAELQPGDVKEISKSTLETGLVGYIDDSLGLHAMSADNGDCITLHVYSPPTRVSTVVEPENAIVMQRVPGFWSYGGVLLAQ